MKSIIVGLFFLALCWTLQAQSFDDLIAKRTYINCKDVSYNAPELIHSLYSKGETDSLYSFLDYWQTKCGEQEHILAMQILLDIKTANFDSSAVNPRLFDALIRYKENQGLMGYNSYGFGYELDQLYFRLRKQAQTIASDIQETYSADEALLKDFYARDSSNFNSIKRSSAKESKLKKLYDQKIADVKSMPQLHVAFFASYYRPYGKLDIFGQHMGLGGIFGINRLRHTFDFVIDIRFGQSAKEYEFVFDGNLMKDDKWTSAYVGAEYTYDFYTRKKISLGVSPGIAYNGITAVPADDEDDDPKILPGLDVSGGLSFRYTYGKRGGYIGLQTRYHHVDHRNPGGTELVGSYLSMRLIFGSIFNYGRDYELAQLDY